MKKIFVIAALFIFSLPLQAQWVQIGNDIDGQLPGDGAGQSVSISSNGYIIAVGSPWNADNGINSGQVRIYENSNPLSTEQIQQNNVIVSPNPANNSVSIKTINMDISEISLYNIQGKLLYNVPVAQTGSYSFQIDLSNFNSGVYFLDIKTPNASYKTKIIKQ